MAKKKTEEYAFKAPKFDEAEFLKKELLGAKTTFLTIAFAFAMALVSFALARAVKFSVAFVVGFLAIFGLKFVFLAARVEPEKVDRKLWLSAGGTYFFAWLAFWALVSNSFQF
jgi:hypothetical protein